MNRTAESPYSKFEWMFWAELTSSLLFAIATIITIHKPAAIRHLLQNNTGLFVTLSVCFNILYCRYVCSDGERHVQTRSTSFWRCLLVAILIFLSGVMLLPKTFVQLRRDWALIVQVRALRREIERRLQDVDMRVDVDVDVDVREPPTGGAPAPQKHEVGVHTITSYIPNSSNHTAARYDTARVRYSYSPTASEAKAVDEPQKSSQLVIHDEDDKHCPICTAEFESGDKVLSLPCGHSVHFDCTREWWKKKLSCTRCTRELVWRLDVKERRA